jgi:hypothetical protein
VVGYSLQHSQLPSWQQWYQQQFAAAFNFLHAFALALHHVCS